MRNWIFLTLIVAGCSSDKDENCPPCPDVHWSDGVYNNVHFSAPSTYEGYTIKTMVVDGELVTLTYTRSDGVERSAVFRKK